MFPERIKSFFELTHQKNDGDNHLIEGTLTCCDSHDFEVFVMGRIIQSISSGMYLIPDDDKVVLEVRCKNCGRVITVFDSSCNGYEQCTKNKSTHTPTKLVSCKKCHDICFSVHVKYEYPDIQELKELGTVEVDNAFTWIWISLECRKCGTTYKNFVDYETD